MLSDEWLSRNGLVESYTASAVELKPMQIYSKLEVQMYSVEQSITMTTRPFGLSEMDELHVPPGKALYRLTDYNPIM